MREGGKTLCQRSGSSIGPDKNSWLLTFRLPLFFLFFFAEKLRAIISCLFLWSKTTKRTETHRDDTRCQTDREPPCSSSEPAVLAAIGAQFHQANTNLEPISILPARSRTPVFRFKQRLSSARTSGIFGGQHIQLSRLGALHPRSSLANLAFYPILPPFYTGWSLSTHHLSYPSNHRCARIIHIAGNIMAARSYGPDEQLGGAGMAGLESSVAAQGCASVQEGEEELCGI